MDSFNRLNHSVSEGCLSDPKTYVSEKTRALNHESARLHLRHLASWLLRAAFIASLFMLAELSLGSELGGIVKWASALMTVYLLVYAMKGHKAVRSRRKAGLYWLHDEAVQAQRTQRKPVEKPQLIIAGSLGQDPIEDDVSWVRKQALS